MIKPLIILSALAAVSGQDYGLINNLVDFEDPYATQYQRMPLPYQNHDYRDNRVTNLRRKLIKNAIVESNGLEVIKRPANLIETGQIVTSLSSLQTSLTATMNSVITKLLGSLSSVLNLITINLPSVMFGAALMIGFCKITSLLSKFSIIQSVTNALKGLSSLITSEKFNMASEYVQDAMRTYGS